MFAHEPEIEVEEGTKPLGMMRDFTFHRFSLFNPFIASLLDKCNLSSCLYLKTVSSVFSFCKFWFNLNTASSVFSTPPLIMLHKFTGLRSSSLDMPLAHPALPSVPQPGRLHLVNTVTGFAWKQNFLQNTTVVI